MRDPRPGDRFHWRSTLNDPARGNEGSVVVSVRHHPRKGHLMSVTWRYESETGEPWRGCMVPTFRKHARFDEPTPSPPDTRKPRHG